MAVAIVRETRAQRVPDNNEKGCTLNNRQRLILLQYPEGSALQVAGWVAALGQHDQIVADRILSVHQDTQGLQWLTPEEGTSEQATSSAVTPLEWALDWLQSRGIRVDLLVRWTLKEGALSVKDWRPDVGGGREQLALPRGVLCEAPLDEGLVEVLRAAVRAYELPTRCPHPAGVRVRCRQCTELSGPEAGALVTTCDTARRA